MTPGFAQASLQRVLGMRIDKILTIPMPYRFLLIDSIPYRFFYRFLLGKG